MGNVARFETRLQKLEQYIGELKRQQGLTFEQLERFRAFTLQSMKLGRRAVEGGRRT